METTGQTPEIERLKQELSSLLIDAPHNPYTVIQTMQIEQIENVLLGSESWVTYAILEQENIHTPPSSQSEERKRDILQQLLTPEKINEIPSEGDGYSSTVAYKTRFDRIFVTSSSLVRKDGSKVTAFSLVRVYPGEEGYYTWLPEGYFDSTTQSQKTTP